MLKTIKEVSVFKNKFIDIQNNDVIDQYWNNRKYIRIFQNAEHKKETGVVVILKIKNKFLLINLFRYWIQEDSWEFIRGWIEKWETYEEAGLREVFEEVNIVWHNSKLIWISYTDTGILNTEVWFILIEIDSLKNQFIKLQESENINNYILLSKKELKEKILEWTIKCWFTIQWFWFLNLI